MVRPEGVEPPTYWFVASCSIQLSYGRTLQGCNLFRIPKMGGESNPSRRMFRIDGSAPLQHNEPREMGTPPWLSAGRFSNRSGSREHWHILNHIQAGAAEQLVNHRLG